MGINILRCSDPRDISPPIEYTKGKVKTSSLVPVDRNLFLGRGSYGNVFVAKGDETKAVKKSWISMVEEYQIGAQLNHKNLVKIHALFIKHYTNRDLHKLVMDRITGKSFFHIPPSSLPFVQIESLIRQALDTCLYLFDQKICWDDLHGGNVYIQGDPSKLVIADFGLWFTREKPIERARDLVSGLRRLISMILDKSADLSAEERSRFTEIFWEGSRLPRIERCVRRSLEAYMGKIKQWLSLCKDRHPESHAEEPRHPS